MKFGLRLRSVRPGLMAIAIATATFTIAQTNPVVEVTVVDADTGQPIPRAKVILYDGPEPLPDTEVNAWVEREVIGPSPGTRVVPAGRPSPRGARSVDTNDAG